MKSSFHTEFRWVLNIAVLIALALAVVPAQSIQAMDPPYKTYLPLITSPFKGISGRVTLNGTSAAGDIINLAYMINPQTYQIVADFVTDQDGYYYFAASSLTPGYIYNITYWNTHSTSQGKLKYWIGVDQDPYVANSNIVIPTFDIADILLISPVPDTAGSLPMTFQWSMRSATPTDSYKVHLNSGGPAWFSSSLLGYVDSFQLTSLPEGFSSNTAYGWSVSAFSPDGSHGVSFSRNTVTFLNSGSSRSVSMDGTEYTHYLVDGKDYLVPSSTP